MVHRRREARSFRCIAPVLQGGGSLREHDATAIAASLNITQGTLRVALSRHLREYRAVMEVEVRQTVARAEDVEDEIAYLIALFSPGRSASGGVHRSGGE